MIRLLIIITAILIATTTLADNRYEVGGFDDDKAVGIFAAKFKEAVASNDKNTVAAMVFYPIEATLNGKTVIINNEHEFIRLYADIFDKNLLNKIANSDTHNMFSNYQGVMLGDGEAWFSMENGNIKVVAVGVCRRYYPDTK